MIEIKGKDSFQLDNADFITGLYKFIEKDVTYFIVLRDILFTYSDILVFDLNEFEQDKEAYKERFPVLENPKSEEFFNIIEELFEAFSHSQEKYSVFRGELTEYIVSKAGPYFFPFREVEVVREAVFIKNGTFLQPIQGEEHRHNMDICFHENRTFSSIEDVVCEILECKINIRNFFRDKLLDKSPKRKKDRQDQNKIRFMEALGKYFSANQQFKIAFATLSNNVEYSRQWLSQFPTFKVEIVSAEMIEESLKRKALLIGC